VTVFTVVYGRIFEEQKQQDAAAASGQCSSGDPTEAAQRQWQKRLQSADNKAVVSFSSFYSNK
jgi:hypothetical protein